MGDRMNKVVIVGCGNVGMSYAYALLNQKNSVNELVLIDLDKERTIGEAMDLNHCLAFGPNKMKIIAGEYADCKDAAIVCIAAGANQKPGDTRMDLIHKNSSIFKDIVGQVMQSGFNGIFLIATNPLDVMTYLTWKYSGLDTSHIIGTGTSLDTARLRFLIGDRLKINPKNVHAYVIGEHGDSEFIPWSNVNIGLKNIQEFLDKEDCSKIEEEVRNAAYEIINRKGATYYGIGMCLARITSAILNDENTIITVSSYDKENNLFISLPTIINKEGVTNKLFVNLNEEEERKLRSSIEYVKEAIDSLENE